MRERYRVTRLIKRGGMGEVFEGRVRDETGLERRVAIKRLSKELAEDPAMQDAFLDEARIVRQLSHPNIVRLLEYGLIDGLPMQVYELVDGTDLGDLRTLGTPPRAVSLYIMVCVAEALAHAHAAKDETGRPLGLIHRDVKPTNVLVSWAGAVKLADFGMAKAKRKLFKTRVGAMRGTPGFMAPEQASGARADPRVDVFGLGCVLHFLLAGSNPLADEEKRLEVWAGAPFPIQPELDDSVAAIVRRATHFSPSDRHPTAEAFAEACRHALDGARSETLLPQLTDFLHSVAPKPEADVEPTVLFRIDAAPTPEGPEGSQAITRFTAVRPAPRRWALAFVIVMLASAGVTYRVITGAEPDAIALRAPPAPARPSVSPRTDDAAVALRAPPPLPADPPRVSSQTNDSPVARRPPPSRAGPSPGPASGSLPAAGTSVARRARSARPRPPDPTHRTRLAAALAARGLEHRDLKTDPVAAAALERFRNADGRARRRALDELLAAVDRVDISPALLRTKLARVLRTLKSLEGSVPPTHLQALEDRYFEARRSVRTPMSAADGVRAARSIAALQADLSVHQ